MTTANTRYVAMSFIMSAGAWGTSLSLAEAVNTCRREANEIADVFGGWKKGAILKVNVWEIPDGSEWSYYEDRGFRVGDEPLERSRLIEIDPKRKWSDD